MDITNVFDDRSRKEHERKLKSYEGLEIKLSELAGTEIHGIYDRDEDLLEINNVVYSATSRDFIKKIRGWINKGLVVEGHVNKYKERGNL